MTRYRYKSETINQSQNSGTEEPETDLFREAMADIEPLRTNLADTSAPKPRPLLIEQPPEPKPLRDFADVLVETHDVLEFCRPGIQHRVFHELRRGRIIPEASLDLHGYRVEEARKALPRFLDLAQARGLRCIRIIHGKGKGSAGQQPILKQRVNQWLPQSQAVLAFCSAPRWDGGTGATYVLLARSPQENID
jgi:DNA-nicking Smr family endonuclease